jgi:hypothetical protein
MFLMRADTLRGQVGGGWALEISSFLASMSFLLNFDSDAFDIDADPDPALTQASAKDVDP